MPVPRLQITLRDAESSLDKLESFRVDSAELPGRFQHMISELICLRCFYVLENTVAEIAFKLVAGALYLNDTAPTLSTTARTVSASRGLLLTHNRAKAVQNLKWTKAKDIRKSVEHVIDVNDPFVRNAQTHGNSINEMRIVRNTLAHNSKTTRAEYRKLLRLKFGAQVKLPVGAYLTTTRHGGISFSEAYLITTRIILRDLASGN